MTEVVNLEAGEKSPSFTAIDSEGKSWSSDDLAAEGKSVILYFYPKIRRQAAPHKPVIFEII